LSVLSGQRISICVNTAGSLSSSDATLRIFPQKASPLAPFNINAVLFSHGRSILRFRLYTDSCYTRSVFIRHANTIPESYVRIPIMIILQFDLPGFGESSEYQSLSPIFIHAAV